MDTTTDFTALKNRQQVAWASGDYAVIGTTLQIVGESLAEACDLRWDDKVLDVAAGNGNASLAAARRGCSVTSTDYVGALLERGAERARAERLEIRFQPADAEALPFADASFDAVLSTFGVMFTPDHAKSAAEMVRVCRPGGRIGLANWTPDGFVGQIFKTLARHLPPPPGAKSPSLWGVESHLQSLFAATSSSIRVAPRTFSFRYRSPAHFVEVFRAWYGPLHKAFEALPVDAAAALQRDLIELLERMNTAGRQSLVVPSEYLEIVDHAPIGILGAGARIGTFLMAPPFECRRTRMKISVRDAQSPLRARYRETPALAMVTDHARTGGIAPSDPFHTGVEPMDGCGVSVAIGVHRALGGPHDAPTPGDMLCAALAACQDSSIRMVANLLGIELIALEVRVRARVDVRGTMAMDRDVPVGFQSMTCDVGLEASQGTPPELLDKLRVAAERCCVVLQTLRRPPPVQVTIRT